MLTEYTKLIRPISISIVRNRDTILAYERHDDVTKKTFHRLVGGCIEFGETSIDALKREFYEELSLKIMNIKLLESFESIFTFNNKLLHEIVYLYESEFQESSVYDLDEIIGLEGDREFIARWIPVSDFIDNRYTLYPTKLMSHI